MHSEKPNPRISTSTHFIHNMLHPSNSCRKKPQTWILKKAVLFMYCFKIGLDEVVNYINWLKRRMCSCHFYSAIKKGTHLIFLQKLLCGQLLEMEGLVGSWWIVKINMNGWTCTKKLRLQGEKKNLLNWYELNNFTVDVRVFLSRFQSAFSMCWLDLRVVAHRI